MANNIPLTSIPAPVIQLNNDLYLVDGQFTTQTKNVPCGVNALIDDVQHWAVPIKDFGICTNIFFQPAVGDYPPGTPPTPDSLLVLRVRDKYNPKWTWWVACTKADYYASCQVCCDDPVVPIPNPVLPIITPCQNLCDAQNGAGNYFTTWGAPDLGAGETYLVYGQYNGDELIPFESTSLTDLINDLNSNYGSLGGSPASATVVWTRSGNIIIGTFQNGDGVGDSFCLLIVNGGTSP